MLNIYELYPKEEKNKNTRRTMEEEAAKRLLDTLAALKFVNDRATVNRLITEISEYTELLPTAMNIEEINHVLYGKIIEALFRVLETNVTLVQEKELYCHLEKLMILEGSNFFLSYELLLAIFSFLKQPKDNKLTGFIIGIVERIMRSDSLCFSLISACRKIKHINAIEADEHERIFKKYVQLLVSIPMRISNQMKSQTPKTFSLHNFSNILSYQLIRVILSYNENTKSEFDMQRFSFVVSKMIISLGCEYFKELMKIFICWSTEKEESCSMRGFIPKMLEDIDKNSIEPIATLLLKQVNNSGDMKIIFGNILRNHSWKFILTTKIPLHSFYKDDKLIINLVTYLSLASCGKEILLELIMKLIDVWGNKSALNHTSLAQQEYITKILLVSIKTIQKDLSHFEKNSIRGLLISGTSVHLDSVQVELRALGMITSQLITNLFDETDMAKLEYDYNLIPYNGKYVVDKLKEFWIYNSQTSNLNNIEHTQVNSAELINNLAAKVDILATEGSSEISTSEYTSKEIIQIERNRNKECKFTDSKEEVKVMANIPNETDLDSDDDLIPYDMSNDGKNYSTKSSFTVIYLRDLKENLINANGDIDPERFAASLQSSESIIISQLSNDDESFALELLMILSKLREITHVDNFHDLKLKSCVAITKIFPKQSAKFLCDEFHAQIGSHSVSDRLFFLNVLTQSIKELSELKLVSDTDTKSNFTQYKNSSNTTHLSKPISLLLNMEIGNKSETLYDDNFEISTKLENKNIIDHDELLTRRIKSNTRIFAHSSKSSPLTANNLNNVLPYFFYPLFYGIYQNHNERLSNIPKYFQDHDNILLINYLHALSTIMIAAENCIVAPNIGKYILELAWNLRYHDLAKVRCCVIENVAAVIIAVPTEYFTHEILELLVEFKLWLDKISEDSVKGDPDFECRSKGKNLIHLMDSVLAPILNVF